MKEKILVMIAIISNLPRIRAILMLNIVMADLGKRHSL
jgi:hypothetical protein